MSLVFATMGESPDLFIWEITKRILTFFTQYLGFVVFQSNKCYSNIGETLHIICNMGLMLLIQGNPPLRLVGRTHEIE